ncbi:hypothetical protein LTR99_005489 [Exophiala xenobiotica]|uniref:EthD domain-containing protein n=1 Tax=Vermiconidia calcicola TaxID=1690605 RepID=A0AAV9Q7N5_9PEZI|nr:hypothetical protein LTR92_004242 [Exophiala xenobiotica]KAK5535752.1 hypothetical protein LTR25_005654 [Vermiconidia calcicola]KAK5548693.1 hypothetical protein LTR23_001182 [Chaetothyriales sp. CCFEE 6169]KAK5227365.1 hypothetical protein LTR72_003355 [Exophiala xenobiotica]KAK5271047.1 hypothetical protein LTR96_004325 [Exophiala xenobiotica]
MSRPRQALLRRNATYTREQFSAHWLKHAAKVTPWALENGITYYAQIHNPRLAPGVMVPSALNVSGWDGAAEMIFERGPDFKSTAKSDDYYQKVILPDERAFLMSEALQHLRWMDPGTVVGDKVVIIEDGKAMIDCEETMGIWKDWTAK